VLNTTPTYSSTNKTTPPQPTCRQLVGVGARVVKLAVIGEAQLSVKHEKLWSGGGPVGLGGLLGRVVEIGEGVTCACVCVEGELRAVRREAA
jgi:hypothetical protein